MGGRLAAMANPPPNAESAGALPRHPVGTLVIVGIYGLLFALGWIAVYFFLFRARGAVTP